MTTETMWTVLAATRVALERLARSRDVDEVAAHLLAAQAHGVPRSAERCPVAVYLRRRGGADAVAVSHAGITVCVVDELGRRWYRVGSLPHVVVEFVDRFDRGQVSELRART